MGMFKILVLTDCSNVYSSVCGVQPRSTDKSIRIVLAYIRDCTNRIGLSYTDAEYNLADLGTKVHRQHHRWNQFLSLGIFQIGFIGRKAVQAIKRHPLKPKEPTMEDNRKREHPCKDLTWPQNRPPNIN